MQQLQVKQHPVMVFVLLTILSDLEAIILFSAICVFASEIKIKIKEWCMAADMMMH